MSIEARHLSKSFGSTRALIDVDLQVATGRLNALLGPSGSGKTTLLRILAGLEFPDPGSGTLHFHGEDVSALNARQRGVGMVFQHYALFRHLSIRDNVAFGLRMRPRGRRPSRRAIAAQVDELLALVQLEGYGERRPHELSGGQRQRVALARALALEPRILLLDEPFGALDAKVRKDLRRWLRAFHERMQLTTIFVTHDQEEALELADEVVVMNHARVEQVGSPQTVFDYPASPFVIEFLGNVNRVAAGLAPRGAGDRDPVYVRPHDIELLPPEAADRGHALAARVVHLFSAGNMGRVTVQRVGTGELLEAEITRSELDRLALDLGQPVALRFRHIRVFKAGAGGRQQLVTVEVDEPIGQVAE